MVPIKGIVRNGQIVLAEPTDWPDGTEVTATPAANGAPANASDAGPMSADEIARTLQAMERVEPFDMTDEERAEIEAGRRKVKEYTIANQDNVIEELFPRGASCWIPV